MQSGTSTNDPVFTLSVIELIIAIFRGPPRDQWLAIQEEGLPQLVESLSGAPRPIAAALLSLQHHLAKINDETVDELEYEFVRLFVTGRGGAAAPPYASCHEDGSNRVMSEPALDMRHRLEGAGLAVALDSNEPPDHICIELEYLYLLLTNGWRDEDAQSLSNATDFVREAMLPWVPRLTKALEDASAHPVFTASAELTQAVLDTVVEG